MPLLETLVKTLRADAQEISPHPAPSGVRPLFRSLERTVLAPYSFRSTGLRVQKPRSMTREGLSGVPVETIRNLIFWRKQKMKKGTIGQTGPAANIGRRLFALHSAACILRGLIR